jgi:hypothetical protein
MGYLEPKDYSEDSLCLEDEFYIRKFNFPEDLQKIESDPYLLFDLPSEMDVRISMTTFSAEIFDYFNPLIVTKDILKKIKFLLGPEVRKTFSCSQLIIPPGYMSRLKHNIVCRKKVFGYTPELSIEYPTMEIVILRGYQSQISDFLQAPLTPAININLVQEMLNLMSTAHQIPQSFDFDGDELNEFRMPEEGEEF